MNHVDEHGLDSLGNEHIDTCSNANDYHMVVQRTKRADELLSYHDIGLFKEWVGKPSHILPLSHLDTSSIYVNHCIGIGNPSSSLDNIRIVPIYSSLELNTWTITEEGRIVLWTNRNKCIAMNNITAALTEEQPVVMTDIDSADANVRCQFWRMNNEYMICPRCFTQEEAGMVIENTTSTSSAIYTRCNNRSNKTSTKYTASAWMLILECGLIHPGVDTLTPWYKGKTFSYDTYSIQLTDRNFMRTNLSGSYKYLRYNASTGTWAYEDSESTVASQGNIPYSRFGINCRGQIFLLKYPEITYDNNSHIITYNGASRTPLDISYCMYSNELVIKPESMMMQRPICYSTTFDKYFNYDRENCYYVLQRTSDGKYCSFPNYLPDGDGWVSTLGMNITELPYTTTIGGENLMAFDENEWLTSNGKTLIMWGSSQYPSVDNGYFKNIYPESKEPVKIFIENMDGNGYKLVLVDKNTLEPSVQKLNEVLV